MHGRQTHADGKGQKSEDGKDRGQRSEGQEQGTEVRGRRSEVGKGQRSEARSQKKDIENNAGGIKAPVEYASLLLNAFFLYLFPKSRRDNIDAAEMKGLKRLTKYYLTLKHAEIKAALQCGELREVNCNEKRT